jgi:hypothetical protein
MGIRTPVVGVRVLHDWPDYTIAAQMLCSILLDPVVLKCILLGVAGGDAVCTPLAAVSARQAFSPCRSRLQYQ